MRSTPFTPVLTPGSTNTANALFTPMTGALPSQAYLKVRFRVEVYGVNGQVLPGIQYSHDGIVWSAPAVLSDSTSWIDVASDPVKFVAGWKSCPAAFGLSGTDVKLFVRFGLFCANTTTATYSSLQGRLTVQPIGLLSGSVTGGPIATSTAGGTAERFTPLTEAVSTASMTSLRASWEMTSSVGGVETRPGYQVSNDGITWSVAAALGSYAARTSDGISYGEDVSVGFSTDSRWVRFGALAKNSSGGAEERLCLSSIRIDWREG